MGRNFHRSLLSIAPITCSRYSRSRSRGRAPDRSRCHRADRMSRTATSTHCSMRRRSLRDRGKGRDVTYSRKVFLPVTNLCRDRCTYCTFRKDPGDPGAWTMMPDEIAPWSQRGARARMQRGADVPRRQARGRVQGISRRRWRRSASAAPSSMSAAPVSSRLTRVCCRIPMPA